MSNYEDLNRNHKGPLTDPCTEYTEKQAIRLCKAKKGTRVLDYGCSIGRAAQEFQKVGSIVYGVDVISKNLKTAAPFCEKTFLRTEQSIPLPFKQNFFDIVFSSKVIEHLQRLDGDAFLKESYKLLRGGENLFNTPQPSLFTRSH